MKRNQSLRIELLLLLWLAMLAGCKDFIEPSLEKRELVLLAPAEGSQTNKYQVGFWWEPMPDALRYRLQIASPDFETPVSLIKDTLVVGMTSLQLTLEPGSYAWRLRAENGSSSTAYFRAGFVIHESSLAEQRPALLSPATGYLSNQAPVLLSWEPLFGAESYRLQIDTLNFADPDKLVYNGSLSGSSYTFSFPKDQTYQWRVQAESSIEVSKWSEQRSLRLDRRPPGKVSPLSPVKGAVIARPLSLSWSPVATAKRYKLYVYKSDGSTAYSSSFPLLLSGTSYTFDQGEPGALVYWKVSALDEAGNEGEGSELMNFTLQ